MRAIPFFIAILLVSCNASFSPFSKAKPVEKIEVDEDYSLNEYWYQGEAQVLTYNVVQNRYNDEHPGEAILIQVSEDFNTNLQVKSDNVKEDAPTTTVLKTNLIERFTTGVYDYSMMTSTFTDVNPPFTTYKITHSSQDWCGQSMVQVNNREGHLEHQLLSYFESEGDRMTQLPKVWLEDEIYNLIRMAPSKIKTGKIKMLPSTKVMRLLHLTTQPQPTELSMTTGKDTSLLTLEMPDLKRTKTISFLTEPPHTITGWEDIYPSVFDGRLRTTRAYIKGWKKIPYWQLNHMNNLNLREELGLRLY